MTKRPTSRKAEPPQGLVGLHIHTFEPDDTGKTRRVHYQGQIVREAGEWVVVQCYEWLTGSEAAECVLIPRCDLPDEKKIALYESAEAMNFAYQTKWAQRA